MRRAPKQHASGWRTITLRAVNLTRELLAYRPGDPAQAKIQRLHLTLAVNRRSSPRAPTDFSTPKYAPAPVGTWSKAFLPFEHKRHLQVLLGPGRRSGQPPGRAQAPASSPKFLPAGDRGGAVLEPIPARSRAADQWA